jgi:CheY-like chemotaxis protein
MKKSVLVVEDDHDVRVSVRQTLEEEGYQVVSAANGHQAIELLSKHQPGLVLVDLRMPIMDGWQFVELLKGDVALARLPVFVHTAYYELEPPAGIDGVLKKPIDANALIDLAHKHCD